jgi:hypothetical protein
MALITTILSIVIIGGVYIYILKKARKQAEGFTIWLIFSVLLALAPLLFNAILTFIIGQSPNLVELLRNGELLLIAVAIGADAVGKLVASSESLRLLKIVASGGSIMLIIVCSFLFAAVSTRSLGMPIDAGRVAGVSGIMFALTVVASGSCTLLAEVQR